MIYGYIRISTEAQHQENQRFEIENFALANNIHIDKWIISQRTKQCLARLKADGRHIGRPKGKRNKIRKLSGKEDLIDKLLSQNIKKTKIAEMLKVDYKTIYTYLKEKAV